MIKDKGGLKAGWCRSFGLAAHTIGVLALAIAHNVKETIEIEETQTGTPKPPSPPRTPQRTPTGTRNARKQATIGEKRPNWPTYLG